MQALNPPALSVIRQIRQYSRARTWCEWDDFDKWSPQVLADLTEAAGPHWPPFLILGMPGIDAATQRVCAGRWLTGRLPASAAESPELLGEARLPLRQAGGPLRVGYLSGDFHQHATALLMVEMLEAHRRERVELYAYSHGADDGKGMRQRLAASFHRFRDIRTLDDACAVAAIRDDDLHILVDLKGYTEGSRTLLLAHRPAPVQVSFLGYPGTLGQNFVDYLISDRFVTPAAMAGDYAEALACMPHSYQPHGRIPPIAGPPPDRLAHGLPESGFVFASFNQPWKFTPEVFDIWCTLLIKIPNSVLWLLDDPQARGNLRNEAFARGVAPHRLVFAPDMAQAQHLARLPLVDLMLDTWPYNAHTTASDALCAGVPLVSCAGATFASRVAGSLLCAAGLPELVTTTPAAYAELALSLALNPQRLEALRRRLALGGPTAPLFDVDRYTHTLEDLFERMWAQHLTGQAPVAIDMPAAASL